MEPADTRPDADALSDALHRALAADADGRCWLMIDPAVRPLDVEREWDARLIERSPIQVRVLGGDPDPRLLPQLIELDSARAADSSIIHLAIEEAIEECSAASLAQGAGRRICGWMQTRVGGCALAAHIGRRLVQYRPGGRKALMRWIDPAGLWALWPLLDAVQRTALLGPVDAYHLLDPAGRWLTLCPDADQVPTPTFGLSPAQWADLEAIGALNLALREWGAAKAATDELAAGRQIALAALRRAKALGFADDRDLAAFAGRALSVHPLFHQHPLVRERLAKRAPDDYFTALVDDLAAQDWQRVRAECARHAASPQPQPERP